MKKIKSWLAFILLVMLFPLVLALAVIVAVGEFVVDERMAERFRYEPNKN